ncbi:MAG: alpha/beta hydrolase [Pseudomonadota bacterium]
MLAFSLTPLAAFAQAQVSPEILAGDIPPDRLDTLIAENVDNPRLVFDLIGLKAEAAIEAGNPLGAAEAYATQAALALRHPAMIQADVPALHLDAADALTQAGNTDLALDQLYAALSALQERAANPETLQALMQRIAELEEARGQTAAADRLRAAAAAVPPHMDEPPANRSDDAGFVRVEVYYATDRALTGDGRPARMFDADRADGLNYGTAEVTIPRTHVAGQLESPSVWRFEFSENPAKHVMLQSVTPVDPDSFFGAMQSDLAESGARDAFVFVHGYNVSFDGAVKRTAQLAHDMNFRGLPILYSWPSKGATVGYIPDTAVVRLSGRRLTAFLDDLVEKSGATTIHLIAHSMGNRAMTDALELMALRHAPIEEPIFDQLIFAAPDVDRDLFAAMMPTIRPLARRMTLYASDQDWALEASRKLHGNQPRAGQGGDQALLHENVDTIDMSELGNDMLAHSYVANEQSAILDISMLFWRNPDPENRCGIEGTDPEASRQVWRYAKADCSNANLLPVVATLRNQGALSRAQVRETLSRTFADADPQETGEALLLELAAE